MTFTSTFGSVYVDVAAPSSQGTYCRCLKNLFHGVWESYKVVLAPFEKKYIYLYILQSYQYPVVKCRSGLIPEDVEYRNLWSHFQKDCPHISKPRRNLSHLISSHKPVTLRTCRGRRKMVTVREIRREGKTEREGRRDIRKERDKKTRHYSWKTQQTAETERIMRSTLSFPNKEELVVVILFYCWWNRIHK